MKKFIYLLAVAAIVAACSGNKGYVVTGTVEGGADGDTVFAKVDGRNLVKVELRSYHKRHIHLQRCTRYCRKPLRDLQTGRKRRHINGLFP